MVYLFKKIKNGKICWYLGESKRENGKVRRTWQKYLGTAENVGEALKHGVFPKETDVLEFGLCAALLKIDSEIKFKDSVDNILKKREQGLSYGEHLLLTVINRIDNPTSKNKFSNWFDSTFLKRIFSVKKEYLSSQDFWNHWNHISEENINKIQEELLKKIIPLVKINDLIYDPTNFTTYIEEHKNQGIMQFGHSKDGRRLRQVNLALLVTKEQGIPLWHHIYDGKKKVVITYSNELAYKNKIRVDKALNKALNQLKNIQARLKNSNLKRDELLIKVSKIVGKQWIKGLIDYQIKENGDLSFSFKENTEAY